MPLYKKILKLIYFVSRILLTLIGIKVGKRVGMIVVKYMITFKLLEFFQTSWFKQYFIQLYNIVQTFKLQFTRNGFERKLISYIDHFLIYMKTSSVPEVKLILCSRTHTWFNNFKNLIERKPKFLMWLWSNGPSYPFVEKKTSKIFFSRTDIRLHWNYVQSVLDSYGIKFIQTMTHCWSLAL